MTRSSFVFALALCAATAVAQTKPTPSPSPTPTAPPSATVTPGSPSVSGAGSALQPRGVDAVAKETPNKVVATVNGKQITAKEAADLIDALSPQERRQFESRMPDLVQQIFAERQMADDAMKQSLDQKTPVKQQIELSRDSILTQAYLRNLIDTPAEADKAKQYYDAHAAEFDQVKISGILVAFNPPGTPASNAQVTRTESDAQAKAADLQKKIKSGGDFAALARTDSDQQQTAAKGGELGSFQTSNLPAEIRDAVAKLQPGQVSDPARTTLGGTNGYLLIKLDNRSRMPFDQVKQNLIAKLEVEKYKIHVEDPEFFAPTQVAPAGNVPSLARPNSSPTTPGATAIKPPGK